MRNINYKKIVSRIEKNAFKKEEYTSEGRLEIYANTQEELDEGKFVFALCGEWGTGKTSILNLTQNKLSKRKFIIKRYGEFSQFWLMKNNIIWMIDIVPISYLFI